MTSRNIYGALGPPDPIDYLRSAPVGRYEVGRYDSDEEGITITDDSDDTTANGSGEEQHSSTRQSQYNEKEESNVRRESSSKSQVQDPPARERPADGSEWPYRETLSFTRSLIFYGAGFITEETELACRCIQEARALRQKYCGGSGIKIVNEEFLSGGSVSFRMGQSGVAEVFAVDEPELLLIQVPQVEDFHADYNRLVELVSEGAMRSFCFQRLQTLSTAFKMHITLNATIEMEEQSNLLGTDFYRTMKVDNHIHAAAAPSAKQFVKFLRNKLQTEANTPVCNDGTTLKEVYEKAGLDTDHLTIDAFNVLADYSVYQRFDNFNSKISPFRMADFRRIFLKTTNNMGGRYFAELLKNVIKRHEQSKGHNSTCEMRLSIYGMERHEWYDLAVWMMRDWNTPEASGPMISTHNRWLIQIPRLWRIYSAKPVGPGQPARSFQEMIDNIFIPMFEATLHPADHPEISEALKHIVGIDSVDDEGVLEETCSAQKPGEWTSNKNPSYWWQLYFLKANLDVLNRLRESRGLNTFALRPHAGETGDPMHLAATYILCDSINHGILLDMQVSLQYLYYLDQIGLSISPLSNNFLFRKIAENPFPKFFRRGLNVTISTDDPLLFHLSDDALLEEYSVARATFDLSMTDMMEIARNSVLQSGFEDDFKQKWLGKEYKRGLTFCDEKITHVPLIRAKFRAEHLALEHMLVHLIAAGKGDKVLHELKIQFGLARDAHRDVLFDNFTEVPSFPERGQL